MTCQGNTELNALLWDPRACVMDIAQNSIWQFCPGINHIKSLIAFSPIHVQFRNWWGGKKKQTESRLDHGVYETDHFKGLLK